MSSVWSEQPSREDRKLTVHMSRLRNKIRGSSPWQVETITKRGYVLVNTIDSPVEKAARPRETMGSMFQQAKGEP
jgi:DNA-binding winged helix-turn-helix (wHTH) protein